MNSFSCKVAARSDRGNFHNIVCINSLSFYFTGIDSLPSTMKYSQSLAIHVSTCCQCGSEHWQASGIELEIVERFCAGRNLSRLVPWRCFVDSIVIFFHMNRLFTSVALLAAFAFSFPFAALALVENR
jgi:hypothetical protein